ncbi:hypothetical protein N7445_001728 [Penicillium cf. griseofulvum]|nr:hypothetical protein N7445_001728 [Penicillium cf. griseofulvum]
MLERNKEFSASSKLVDATYGTSEQKFIKANGIQVAVFVLKPNKGQDPENAYADINAIMGKLIDVEYHPIFTHCSQGKNMCILGIVPGASSVASELQGWKLEDILAESQQYAGPKARTLDERFIELYEPGSIRQIAHEAKVDRWGQSQ